MQRLNAREYFVIVLIGIITIILGALLYKELFSETSPLMTNADGDFVNVDASYIINIGNTILQIILGVIAFVFLIMKRRTGWIAAFSLLFLFAFIGGYIIGQAAIAGLIDILFWIGLALSLTLFSGVIFLCVPSTLKKYNVTKTAVIPTLLILLLLVSFYFFIPQ